MADVLIWLVVGLAAGGAAGWFGYQHQQSRKPPPPPPPTVAEVAEARDRASTLEAALQKATAEVEDLRTRSGIARPGEEGLPLLEGSLAWRLRHQETRVRFLEAKLTEVETSSAQLSAAEARAGEAQRLRWRNTYLEGRVRYLEEELVRTGGIRASAPAAGGDAERTPAPEGEQPETMEAPRNARADDLRRISGIGPKLEQKLNSLGIWHYDQIAAWTQANVDWVNTAISFRGRIERERWVSQAKQLMHSSSAKAEAVPETQDS
jgi:predicted flap endonuclease-1-like 5' DNA nuclease